jgi:hypothetical protein
MKLKGRHLNLFIALGLTLMVMYLPDLPFFVKLIDIVGAGFNWLVWFVLFKDAVELTYKEPEGFD